MLQQFQIVWATLGDIISALPNDILTVVAFFFCGVGVIGLFRSF